MVSLILLLMTGCMTSKQAVPHASVDVIQGDICEIQMTTGEILQIQSKFCRTLKEGDIIKLVRYVDEDR